MQPNIHFEFRERYRTCAILLLLLVPLLFWYHQIASIPTPPFVTLEWNRLSWDNQNWQMDLNTRQIERRKADYVHASDQKRFSIRFLRDTEQLAVTVENASSAELDSSLTTRSALVTSSATKPGREYIVDLWGLPDILTDRYLICASDKQIQAADLEASDSGAGSADAESADAASAVGGRVAVNESSPATQSTTHPPIVSVAFAPATGVAGSSNLRLMMLHGTNRFLHTYAVGTKFTYSLFQIERDQIRLLNSWTGSGTTTYANERLYNCQSVPGYVEVRAATNGKLVESIPFPNAAAISMAGPPNAAVYDDVLVLYDNTYSRFVIYDLQRKQVLELPDNHYFPVVSSKSHYIVLLSKLIGDNQQLIYDRHRGQVTQQFTSPVSYSGVAIYDAQHAYIGSREHGITAALVDMTTGREVGRWSPYGWASWSSLLFIPIAVAWIVSWCRASAQAGMSAWIDVYLVGGLLVAMAAYQVTRTEDLSLLTAAVLLLACIQCAAWWMFRSTTRLIVRVSLFLLTFGLAQSAFLFIIASDDQRWGLIGASVIAVSYLGLLSLLLGRRRYRIEPTSNVGQPTSIRDYLTITVTAAIAINSIRMTMSGLVGQELVLAIAIFLPGFFSVICLIVGFSGGWRLLRVGLWLVAAGVVVIVSFRAFELLTGVSPLQLGEQWLYPRRPESQAFDREFWSQLSFFGEAMIAGLLAPFLTAIPFRLRMGQLPGNRSLGELEPAR